MGGFLRAPCLASGSEVCRSWIRKRGQCMEDFEAGGMPDEMDSTPDSELGVSGNDLGTGEDSDEAIGSVAPGKEDSEIGVQGGALEAVKGEAQEDSSSIDGAEDVRSEESLYLEVIGEADCTALVEQVQILLDYQRAQVDFMVFVAVAFGLLVGCFTVDVFSRFFR